MKETRTAGRYLKNEEEKEGRDAFKRQQDAAQTRRFSLSRAVAKRKLMQWRGFVLIFCMAFILLDLNKILRLAPFPTMNFDQIYYVSAKISQGKKKKKTFSWSRNILLKKRNVPYRGQREGPTKRWKKSPELVAFPLHLKTTRKMGDQIFFVFFLSRYRVTNVVGKVWKRGQSKPKKGPLTLINTSLAIWYLSNCNQQIWHRAELSAFSWFEVFVF